MLLCKTKIFKFKKGRRPNESVTHVKHRQSYIGFFTAEIIDVMKYHTKQMIFMKSFDNRQTKA